MEDSKKQIYRGSYSPAPPIPSWFTARLNAIFGFTLSGKPKGRVVWGMDARGFPFPDNQLKYISPNDALVGWGCWILEQWVESEFFGKHDDWERNRWGRVDGKRVELMAAYPSEGEYVLVQPLASPDGEMFPLSDVVLDYISWLVRNAHSRPHNAYTSQQLIKERNEAIKQARAERQKEIDAELEILYDKSASTEDHSDTREYSLPA